MLNFASDVHVGTISGSIMNHRLA